MSSLPAASDPTLDRLEDQLAWYDRKSGVNQRWYKRLKLVSLLCAALIPALSFTAFGPPAAAALGVVIVLAEGLQQLNQYQANWIAYRSTCESLRHEKYLYLATAGPYAASEKPKALLAERVEATVSQEHAKWISSQEQLAAKRASADAQR